MNLRNIIKEINILIQTNSEKLQWFLNEYYATLKTSNSIINSSGKFEFTPETFHKIADVLALTFNNENENESNVCFANNKDLRYEFKDSFSAEDVLNCLYAVLNLEVENSTIDLIAIQKIVKSNQKPEIQKTFWELVEIGKKVKDNRI